MSGTRPRGFAPWRPQADTRVLLAQVIAVLAEYAAYLPLAIRQIFYRLVGTVEYPKEETAYARLCEGLNRARRAGLISFDAIRDDGVTRHEPNSWTGVAQFRASVAQWAAEARLDRQEGQPVRLWLLCEAAGMAPQLARVADPYGVPVLASGGFDSLTAKYQLAREMVEADTATEILHIGDHDPSGVHLFTSLAEDVASMCAGLGGEEPAFTRLAVTPAQIADFSLPTAPPKTSDRRSFVGLTVQAEAIPPDVLGAIVARAIKSRQGAKIRLNLLAREQAMRAELLGWLGGEE